MKLRSIQMLRGLAAVLVVYTHSIDLQMDFSTSIQQRWLHLQDFGAVGVDIFFVISGFIITYVAGKYSGIKAAGEFVIKRFIRINPVYYIASICYLCLFILFSILLYKYIPVKMFDQLPDTLLIFPLTASVENDEPLLIIGWTLGFEWLFYTFFCILIALRSSRKVLHLSTLILILVVSGRLFTPKDYRLIFLTNPIMLEFVAGAVICWLYFRLQISKKLSLILILLGVAGYCYTIVTGYGNIAALMTVKLGISSVNRLLLWGIPSVLLVTGCVFREKACPESPFWNIKLLILIGDASYSIYLTHLIFFCCCAFYYIKWGFFWPPDLSIFFQLVSATLVGIGFYTAVEKPLLNYLHNRLNTGKYVLPSH